ncbi:MAG: GTP pyrophosphokinase family protein [Oscillospiraceae bacterium]|nr:GTP pyrophosphokinase family protein [Oscillospiraceae bacterium]
MENFPLGITSAECEFYGDRLILLEGVIEEFLSCLHMVRRYQISRGQRDPIVSFQTRIKSAGSMKAKLKRQNLPVTADSALRDVWDAAGVRLVCPFVQNIDQTVDLIRQIPGIRILREKDYIRNPKPNGYRSYHMILSLPLRFLETAPEQPVWLEVQLRTIAMDCWASIEHQLKYKQDIADQALIVQELKRCADEIASTDLSLQTIRDLIEASGEEETLCES